MPKVPVEGLKHTIDGLKGPAVQKPAANDAGDISWEVPMVKFYFPASVRTSTSTIGPPAFLSPPRLITKAQSLVPK